MEQVGREPRLLALDLADWHHLIHRRHVTERKHGCQRRMAADLAAFHRNACSAAGGAGDFCWEHGWISLGSSRIATDQALGARPSCAQYQSMVGGRPCASA